MDTLVTQGQGMQPGQVWLLLVALLWVMPWKGFAMWRAAKRGEKGWFIALLIVNTFALLEIVYIFFWDKWKKAYHERKSKKQKPVHHA